MDIHCKFCGEPWDHDELHDMPDHQACARGDYKAISYARAVKRFARLGCGAWEEGSRKCTHAVCDPVAAEASAMVQDESSCAEDWIADFGIARAIVRAGSES